MDKRSAALLLAAALFVVAAVRSEGKWEGDEEGSQRKKEGTEAFLLQDAKQVAKTEAGEMKVVRGGVGGGAGRGGRLLNNRRQLQIGFITMEPQSLLVPQYFDCSIALFIRRGEATVGNIYKDEFVERKLKKGDLYRIEGGSAVYLANLAEGQRLHAIFSIADPFDFQMYYVGGGKSSVLAGFDRRTVSTALNVSEDLLSEFFNQDKGSFVSLAGKNLPNAWSNFLDMDPIQKTAHMKRIVLAESDKTTWSFQKMVTTMFGLVNKNKKKPKPFNLYDRKPDFQNNYGSSIALTYSDYKPLKYDDIGVYFVKLNAGSMMAPHFNPRASEYGVVLQGCGTIQIVYPNGTLAMNAEVCEGDVFWVPQYFPFCQIASRTGTFVFFGFTTCADYNDPQFLVGQNSLLQKMSDSLEFAAGFGQQLERFKLIVKAQNETQILPATSVSPPGEMDRDESVHVTTI